MNKSILTLLSAALIAAAAAPAFADTTVHGSDVDVTFLGFTPVSNTGNSFTFSNGPYVEDGVPNHASMKQAFYVDAHEGKALTGKLSFTMDVQYNFEAPPAPWPYPDPYTASARASIDVLSPNCDHCGVFDSELLGNAQGGNGISVDSPTSGMFSFASDVSDATGSYDKLIAYMFYDLVLNPAYGSMSITSLTVSFDTVTAASPVPELPPFAMMGAGLAALGLFARYRKAKQAN